MGGPVRVGIEGAAGSSPNPHRRHSRWSTRLILQIILVALGVLVLVLVAVAEPGEASTTVPGQTITTDTTWTPAGSPYMVTGAVIVAGSTGPTLTIEPGVEVRFNTGTSLTIGPASGTNTGALRAIGSSEDPILFTSAATPKVPGAYHVLFQSSATGPRSYVQNVTAEYGGAGSTANLRLLSNAVTLRDVISRNSSFAAISVGGSYAETITNVTVRDSLYGLHLNPASPRFVDVRIESNSAYGIFATSTTSAPSLTDVHLRANAIPMRLRADVDLSTTTFGGDTTPHIELFGLTLTSDKTLITVQDAGTGASYSYALLTTLTVSQGATLTLPPGTVIKLDTDVILQIGTTATGTAGQGSLIADGTEAQPILLTSLKTSSSQYWQRLSFYGGSSQGTSSLRHVTIENAKGSENCGSNVPCGSLRIYRYNTVTLDRILISGSTGAGLVTFHASPTDLRDIRIVNVGGDGVIVSGDVCVGSTTFGPTINGLNIKDAGGAGISFRRTSGCGGAQPTLSGTFENVTITSPGAYGILTTSGYPATPTFRNVMIDEPGNNGVHLADCGISQLQNATIESALGYGVFVGSSCGGAHLDDVRIWNATIRVARNRVDLRNDLTFNDPPTLDFEYWGGTITSDYTLPLFHHAETGEKYTSTILSSFTVNNGARLTIPADSVIRLANNVVVNIGNTAAGAAGQGSLTAEGTIGQPIVLRSLDSTASSFWQGLYFYGGSSTGTSVLRNVTIENAKGNADCGLGVHCGSLRINRYNTITLDRVMISGSTGAGLVTFHTSPMDLRDIRIVNVGGDGVIVSGDVCAGSGTFAPAINGLNIVDAGGAGISFRRTNNCGGTAPTLAGTFENVTITSPGSHGILTTSSYPARPVFRNVIIEGSGNNGIHLADCGIVEVGNATVESAVGYGVFVGSSCGGAHLDDVRIWNATIRVARNRVDLRNDLTFNDPPTLDFEYWGGTITSDYTLPLFHHAETGEKYTSTILSSFTVDNGARLTIPAGSTLRLANNVVLQIGSTAAGAAGQGSLTAEGTSEAPIILRNLSSPSTQFWERLYFVGNSPGGTSVLRNVTIDNAKGTADCGNGFHCGALRIARYSTLTMDRIVISGPLGAGLTSFRASPTDLRNIQILNAGGDGLIISDNLCLGTGTFGPTIRNLTIHEPRGNGIGFRRATNCGGTPPTITGTFTDVAIVRPAGHGVSAASTYPVLPTFNNVTIDGPGLHGFQISDPGTTTLNDVTILSPGGSGIVTTSSAARVNLNRVVVENAVQEGFLISSGGPHTIRGSVFANNRRSGIHATGSGTLTLDIRDSFFYDNLEYGLDLESRHGATIANNEFSGNGISNVRSLSTTPNTWNVEKQLAPGKNIAGGPYLGGNLWHDYDGGDFELEDGLGETPYTTGITAGGDALPLVGGFFASIQVSYPELPGDPKFVSLTSDTVGGLEPADWWEWDFGDGSPKEGTQDVTHAYAEDGQYTVKLTAVNPFGQRSSVTKPVWIDSIKPITTRTTTAGTVGTNGWFKSTATPTFGFSATDDRSGVATIWYRLDEGAWTQYSVPIPVPADGSHIFDFYAVDVVGNIEATQQFLFKTDRTLPTTNVPTLDQPTRPDGKYPHGVAASLTGSDALSGLARLEYSLTSTSGPWTTYTQPVVFNNGGSNTIHARTIDNASNVGSTKSLTFTLPKLTPKFTHTVSPCQRLNLDATTSEIDLTPIVAYDWIFGDGATGQGVTISHDYETWGSKTVKLTITDEAGEQASLQKTISVTSCATVPHAPTLNVPTPLDNTVSLTWATPSNGGSSITGYRVYRGTETGQATLLTSLGVTTSYTDAAVSNGATYYYQVSAVNAIGEGARSNERSVVPEPPTEPTAPRSFTATAGVSKVTLSWQAPSSDGRSPITGYNVLRGTASGELELLVSLGKVTSYADSAVTAETTYWYQVAAVNSVGTSPWSEERSATPVPPGPSDPPDASFTATCSFDVEFDASSSTPGTSSIQSYAWTFGDGKSATGVTAYHKYASAGEFTVTLVVTDTAGRKSAPATATLDVPGDCPAIALQDSNIVEADTHLLVTVQLNQIAAFPITVKYSTVDETAVSNPETCNIAPKPRDYTAASGELVFAPGTTELGILVSIHDDGCKEPDETVRLVLSEPRSVILERATATITIHDNDDPGSATTVRMKPAALVVSADEVESLAFSFSLDAYDDHGNLATVPSNSLTAWTLDDPEGGSFDGNTLRFKGKAATFKVQGTFDGLADVRDVRVIPGVMTGIRVIPEAAAPDPGGSVPFEAHGEDQFRNDLGKIPVEWSLTNRSMGSIGRDGLFLSNGVGGKVAVRATSSGLIGFGSVHVTTATVAAGEKADVPASLHKTTTSTGLDLVTFSVGVAEAGVGAELSANVDAGCQACDTSAVQSASFTIGEDAKNIAIFIEAQNGSKEVIPPEVNREALEDDLAAHGLGLDPALFLRVGASEKNTILDAAGLNRFLGEVNITFSVPASYFDNETLDAGNVTLLEYSEGILIASDIVAARVGSCGTTCNFTATVDRFSTFAVVGVALSNKAVTGAGDIGGGMGSGSGAGAGTGSGTGAGPGSGTEPGSPRGGGGGRGGPVVAIRGAVHAVTTFDALVPQVEFRFLDGQSVDLTTATIGLHNPSDRPSAALPPPEAMDVRKWLEVHVPPAAGAPQSVTFHVSLAPQEVPDPARGVLLHQKGDAWVPESRIHFELRSGMYQAAVPSTCCSVFAIAFDMTPPKVATFLPFQAYGGIATIPVLALDNLAVERIEVYVDGVLAATVPASAKRADIDTTLYANGRHNITVVAIDFVGHYTETSAAVVFLNAAAVAKEEKTVQQAAASLVPVLLPLLGIAVVFAGGFGAVRLRIRYTEAQVRAGTGPSSPRGTRQTAKVVHAALPSQGPGTSETDESRPVDAPVAVAGIPRKIQRWELRRRLSGRAAGPKSRRRRRLGR